MKSYPDFSAFGFALLVSDSFGVLGSVGVFGIHVKKEFLGKAADKRSHLNPGCALVLGLIVEGLFHQGPMLFGPK